MTPQEKLDEVRRLLADSFEQAERARELYVEVVRTTVHTPEQAEPFQRPLGNLIIGLKGLEEASKAAKGLELPK
jgi:hypothetical protein